MKRRYLLSMLSLVPLVLTFDIVYFVLHRSTEIFIMSAVSRFFFFGPVNILGAWFLYKPIDRVFIYREDTDEARKRIAHLTWYSTGWISILGVLSVATNFLLLFLFPLDTDVVDMDKMPGILFLTFIPSLLYVNAIFPSFIAYFVINDFTLDLKAKTFALFKIVYPVGKKRIGLTLLFVFLILGFLPPLLVILDIVAVSLGDQYSEFTQLDPLGTVLVDRFIVLVGMIIAVVLITRSFTKPIYSLLRKINKLRDGDYSTQAAVISDDEIGLLTINFNEMVRELEISHNELEEINRTLEIKVKDRTRELSQKNTELEDTLTLLKQMQKQVIVQEKMATLGQLVAGLTHEINTPVGAIRSMNDTRSKAVKKLEAALEKVTPETAGIDHEIGKVLAVISDADQLIDQGTERLSEIIKNLKYFARLDEAETTTADLNKGLDSVLVLIQYDLLKNIDVVREYGEIPPFVCHARKLNHVFLNLLRNACQAIEDEGRITITTRLENDIIQVAIRDTGRGINPDDLESIFDPGFTTKSSAVRASLGLSICYQIVQEHRGNIHVESQPGKGSVFTVNLPIDALETSD